MITLISSATLCNFRTLSIRSINRFTLPYSVEETGIRAHTSTGLAFNSLSSLLLTSNEFGANLSMYSTNKEIGNVSALGKGIDVIQVRYIFRFTRNYTDL